MVEDKAYTLQNDEYGMEEIIEHLEGKIQTFKNVMKYCDEIAQTEGSQVYVECAPSLETVTINVVEQKPSRWMEKLADEGFRTDRIKYLHEKKEYHLRARFRVD